MLVIDASLIVRTLGHNPDYWRVGSSYCKTWSVGFLPLFILCYLSFWNLSRYYAARAVALLSSELRAASEKVQWRRDCPRFSWSHSTVFQKKKLRDCSQCKQTLFEAHIQCNFILMAESFSESSFFASQSPSQYIYWSLCSPFLSPLYNS